MAIMPKRKNRKTKKMKHEIGKELAVALSKGLASDVKGMKLEAGRHNVNGLVRVNGQIVVGAPTEKKVSNNLMSLDFLILALKFAGVTRDSAVDVIGKVVSEYMKGWDGSKEQKKKAKEARTELLSKYDPDGDIAAILNNAIESLPKVPVAGAVKFEGHIEQVTAESINGEIEEKDNVVLLKEAK